MSEAETAHTAATGPAARGAAGRGARGTDLTTGSVSRHLLAFSLPILMGSLLHTAYMVVNAVWIGRFLGAEAMSAITVTFPVFFVLMAVAGGLTQASSILVSQAYGARDYGRVARVIGNSAVLTGLVAALCLAVGGLGAEPVLRAMRTPPEVLPIAVSYFRVFLWTTPFMFGVFLLASVLRGVGDSKTPLWFQGGSLLLTTALDPLLMFGGLGLPRLGLNGTAYATILSQALALGALAWHLRRRNHIAAPRWRNLRVDGPMTRITLLIGVPSMLQQLLVSVGMMVIVGLVNPYGAHSSAAFGIAMRIDQIAFMPAMAVGMAVATLAGQNIGAGHYDRVGEVFRSGVALSCGLTALAAVLAFCLPAWLMGLFTTEADVIAVGATYLRIASLGYLLFAVMFAGNGVVNGAGHTGATTVFTFIAFWAVRIPVAAFLSQHWGRVEGVWYGNLAGLVVGMGVSLAYYFSGRWKKPVVRRGTP